MIMNTIIMRGACMPTNHSLKIDVSQDDSSITIKKGENKTVLYHLEWSDTV